MDEPRARSFLETIWGAVDAQSLTCCQCDHQINPDNVLARTFYLKSQIPAQGRRKHAASFEVLDASDEIVVFHRHLDCLLHSTKFVAISHVWSRDVADIQDVKEKSSAHFANAVRDVRDIPARICKGLNTNHGINVELWHDYISVPQWWIEAKNAILQVIHLIFEKAVFTTVYCPSLHADTYRDMTQDSSAERRCRAISDICNIKYFSRVWTAMEYTQSHKVRFMTEAYTFLSEDVALNPGRETLLTHITERWDEELGAHGNVQDVEEMVGMGYNLVPWQLGPLEQIRQRKKSGQDIPFALAHALLTRRGVTLERDYLHALQGILQLDSVRYETDVPTSLRAMARACLQRGDLSPFFTIPNSIRGPLRPITLQSYGFHDVMSFGLGDQVHSPTYEEVTFNPMTDNFIIKAEHIGNVEDVFHLDCSKGNLYSVAVQMRLVLEREGTNIDGFIRTVGGRLFGQSTARIDARLCRKGRRETLGEKLECLSRLWAHRRKILGHPGTTFELILGESPTLRARCGPEEITLDLAVCLGNLGGSFDPGMADFHLSARALDLIGPLLVAELRDYDGRWQHDEIDVRTLGLYFADGSAEHVDWIVDAIGLSNHSLEPEMTPLTPIEFLRSHGSTVHQGSGGSFVTIICPTCRRRFVLRVPLFADDARVRGSAAWRFPGLKYEFSLEGGAGLLLSGDYIVGRFVWAAQTCDCPGKLGDVEVRMHDLPIPQQNRSEYGQSNESGWIRPGQT